MAPTPQKARSSLRETILQLAKAQQDFASAIRDVQRASGDSVSAFALKHQIQSSALIRFFDGESFLTKDATIERLARGADQEKLGKRICDLLQECNQSTLIRFAPFQQKTIQIAFDLFEAYESLDPSPRIELFGELFGPHSSIVQSVLWHEQKGMREIEQGALHDKILDTLLGMDLAKEIERVASSRGSRKQSPQVRLQVLRDALVPSQFPSVSALAHKCGWNRSSLTRKLSPSSANDSDASFQPFLERLEKLLSTSVSAIPKSNSSVGREIPQRPVAVPPTVAVEPVGSPPVITGATFAYIDEVPTDEELHYMQLLIDQVRVMLERCAQMRHDEARARVQRMLSGSTVDLLRVIKLFGYTYPKDFVRIFEDEKTVSDALGLSNARNTSSTQKGKH